MVSFTGFAVSVLLAVSVKSLSEEYFTDTPPLDYYSRVSLNDCSARFYLDPNKLNLSYTKDEQRTYVGEFAHVVAIGWTAEETVDYLCSGTLVAPKYVLTAAHCMLNGDGKRPDMVRLGDTNVVRLEQDASMQQIGIRSFKRHPEYRTGRKYFDIAIIELETEAKFDAATCSACLWLEKEVPSEKMHAIGYGETIYSKTRSPDLQKIELSHLDKESCSEELPVSTREQPRGFVDEQFCATGDNADTCEGDSGGPIQVERVDIDGSLIPLIVGIVSFGSLCSTDSIGVYTRVASYRDWIESEIQQPVDYLTCTRTSSCYSRRQTRSKIEHGSMLGPIYRVGILWNSTNLNAFQCGATLIDYRFALTSVFCVQLRQEKPQSVIIESTKEVVAITGIIQHPYFSRDDPQNDIALLKLDRFMKHNVHVIPACLNREQGEKQYLQSISAYGTRYASKDSFRIDNYEPYVITTIQSTGSDVDCVMPMNRRINIIARMSQSNLFQLSVLWTTEDPLLEKAF
nr:serine protease 53-like [Aedes albopictus]